MDRNIGENWVAETNLPVSFKFAEPDSLLIFFILLLFSSSNSKLSISFKLIILATLNMSSSLNKKKVILENENYFSLSGVQVEIKATSYCFVSK